MLNCTHLSATYALALCAFSLPASWLEMVGAFVWLCLLPDISQIWCRILEGLTVGVAQCCSTTHLNALRPVCGTSSEMQQQCCLQKHAFI